MSRPRAIHRVAIVHAANEHAATVAARIAEAAAHIRIAVTGTFVMSAEGMRSRPRQRADALFVVGGDGFLLDVVHEFALPIVGWNAGRVGFLMNAVPDGAAGLIADLHDLAAGNYETCVLRRLHAQMETVDGRQEHLRAFNEFVIRALRGQAAHLDVSVDDTALGMWAGDGLAVATTQGSTGFNLNAGGAVLDWSLDAFTAMMSNPLRHRSYASPQMPIVFSGTSKLRVTVEDPVKRPVYVTADGDRARIDHVAAFDVMIDRCNDPITLCFPHAQGSRRGPRFLRQFARTFIGVGDAVR